MAKVKIKEMDLTTSGVTSSLDNIVYVPGYANVGPINEPTLCTNLNEFKRLFGSSPYRFKKEETSTGVHQGDYERGYLYAYDMLASGLQVLYERIVPESSMGDSSFYGKDNNYGKTTYKFKIDTEITLTINAKYPGYYGKDLQISFVKADTDNIGANDSVIDYYYKLTVYDVEDKELEFATVSLLASSDRYIGNYSFDWIEVILNGVVANEKYDLTDEDDNPTITIDEDINLYSLKFKNSTFDVDTEDEVKYSDIIEALKEPDRWKKLEDCLNYNIKFLTSGPYFNVFDSSDKEVAINMLKTAAQRGDSLALIDFDPIYKIEAIYDEINGFTKLTNEQGQDIRDYGACFAPWFYARLKSTNTVEKMPASYGYLLAVASSFQYKPTWVPVAGSVRGSVPGIVKPSEVVSNSLSDKWQDTKKIAVNPILYIRNYGYCIYGNRTMHYNIDGLVANSFLNIRVGSNDIKKVIRDACNQLMFDVNDAILWVNFRGKIEPYLDRMVSGGGIRGYKIERKDTTQKGLVYGAIRIIPVEGVEEFQLDFQLEDSLN